MAIQDRVLGLVAAATSAAAARRWQEAEQLWNQVRALDPSHAQALYSLGVHAFQRSDFSLSIELLGAARVSAPTDPAIPLAIAMVYREIGNVGLEWQAIISVLTIDAYFLPGLLAKAEFMENRQRLALAANVYRDVLKVAPPESQWSPLLRSKLLRAKKIVEEDNQQLLDYLTEKMSGSRELLDAAQIARWDEAVSIISGRSKPYHSVCNKLHVPRLPALPFYDVEMFDWVPEMESCADIIVAELESLIAQGVSGFQPYVAYEPGRPINQWRQLNHNPAWSSYHLWAHGKPVQDNLACCPATGAAIAKVDSARISGVCPNAMFSVLAPHTHIPPHTGETNARLVAHLALIVPEACTLRVGYESREWHPGKVLIFDDTIEHEARNDSDFLRAVLIFDVWNPLLSKAERDMVNVMEVAVQDYRQREGSINWSI